MVEDKLLMWRLRRGQEEALCRIYEKYRDDLVRITAGLMNDVGAAEDIVQEVFLRLVQSADRYEIRKNLKGYLTACAVNEVRKRHRGRGQGQGAVSLEEAEAGADGRTPEQWAAAEEESQRLYEAMERLPYEQKEAVILHIQGQMKFKEIAELQQTSIKTTMSRYKYGLDKLRVWLNSEVQK